MYTEGFEAIETSGSWLYNARNMWLKAKCSIERNTQNFQRLYSG